MKSKLTEGYDAEQKRNVANVFNKWTDEQLENWLKNNPPTPGLWNAIQQGKVVKQILRKRKKESLDEGETKPFYIEVHHATGEVDGMTKATESEAIAVAKNLIKSPDIDGIRVETMPTNMLGKPELILQLGNITESTLTEGSYKGDLQRLVDPEIHIDQHRSKMGEDDDVIVCSFKLMGKEPAQDLATFLETGYDFILDADASPGEVSPGKFLVFFELSRRTTAVDRIWQIVTEVLNLTLQDMDEWRFAYGTPDVRGSRRKFMTYEFTKENLERLIPMSPREYRELHDEDKQDSDDIAAMKNIAQIPVNQTAPKDDEMDALRQAAGTL